MKRSEIFFGIIRIPLDFALAVIAFRIAYHLRSIEDIATFIKKPDLGIFPPLSEFFRLSLYGALLLVIILAFFNLYSLKITVSFSREVKKIIGACSVWLMAAVSYYFLIREFPFSRLALVYSWFFSIILLGAGHLFLHIFQQFLLSHGIGKRRVLLLGSGEIMHELTRLLGQKKIYEIVGRTESIERLEEIVTRGQAEEIIQVSALSKDQNEEVLNFCRANHLEYHFVPDLLEVSRTNVEIKTIDGLPLISLKPTPLDGWGKVLKRTFDLAASGLGLIILSPVFLALAILIKLDSKGPVFFLYADDQKTKVWRVGQKGKLFCCLKFRTMKTGTHSLRYSEELQKQNFRHGSPLVKIHNDPRVTRIGNFLRKYSIDELPQLWNVLKGEMSLVGPRPHLKEEVEKYKKNHKFVLTLKPGITGLGQISGRSDLPFEEEIRLDTYYIENWSLWLDLKILLKTGLVVLKGYKTA